MAHLDEVPLRFTKNDSPIKLRGMNDVQEDISWVMRETGITSRNNVMLILLRNALDDYYLTGRLKPPPAGSPMPTVPAVRKRSSDLKGELTDVMTDTGIKSRNNVIKLLLETGVEDFRRTGVLIRTKQRQAVSEESEHGVRSTTREDLGGGRGGASNHGGGSKANNHR